MEKVEFRVYHTHTFGNNKGKPNPRTFVTLTLYRDPSKGETVKHIIERLKGMLEKSDARWMILTAKETDDERIVRQKREGIIVLSSTPAKESVEARIAA